MNNKTSFLYCIALLLILNSCTLLYRELRYYDADITDHKIFPSNEINKASHPFYFNTDEQASITDFKVNLKEDSAVLLDDILQNTKTTAFLVIRNDSILFENYYHGYDRTKISTLFSVSKSVTSLLVGIALDEGFIDNINDPITKYIPELRKGDPLFKKLTIEHLLNMRSGLHFNESYGSPFSDMARLYYGTNQLGKIKRMHFDHEPGTVHNYQSSSTALLGMAVENATDITLSEYLEQKVWEPLGMENDASWSLDDKRHRASKAYSGLNATAIDLAKIGRLYLNKGKYEGNQIVSEKWVNETLSPNMDNDGYQNQWYSFIASGIDTLNNKYFNDSITAIKLWEDRYKDVYPNFRVVKTKQKNLGRRKRQNSQEEYKWKLKLHIGQYYAIGIMQQLLYIDPEKNTIIVRLGENGDYNYLNLMYRIGH